MKLGHYRPPPRTDADRAKRKAMVARRIKGLQYDVDQVLLDAIVAARPDLRDVKDDVVRAFAQVYVASNIRARRHVAHESCFSLNSVELAGSFGWDQFNSLNDEHRVVERAAGWESRQTIAYRLCSDLREAVNTRYDEFNRARDATTAVIRPDGTTLRRCKSWSSRRNLQNLPRSLVGQATLTPTVPVDVDALLLLDNSLQSVERADAATQADMLVKLEAVEGTNVAQVRAILRVLIAAAKRDVPGYGKIAHEYIMRPTGRLFAQGVNLQSAPKLIKRFAFHGCWQYDFTNCHFTIIQQLADRMRRQCPTITHYLNSRKPVREHLAAVAAADIEDIKTCLIALAYGAGSSHRSQDSIPSTIGLSRAIALYQDPIFKGLHREMTSLASAIIKQYTGRGGVVRNALGLPYRKRKPGETDTAAKREAHILQGIEAQALLAILRQYPEEILLLEHDGFISRDRLDTAEVQRVVKDATKFALTLEERQMTLPAAANDAKQRGRNTLVIQ